MILKLLVLFTLVCSFIAQASDPVNECSSGLGQENAAVEELNSGVRSILNRSSMTDIAERLCSGRMSDGQRRRCYREVERGSYFDSQALGVCSSILNYNPRLRCIRVIRDHTFSRGVTGFCNIMLSDANKVSCLDISQSRVYSTTEINRCRTKTVGFFTHDANRLHCLRELHYERAP